MDTIRTKIREDGLTQRDALLAELAEYRPFDMDEALALERMTAFVARHPDCFERSLTVGHMTAGAWLLDVDGRRVLLTHHRKLGCWLQLGGHADGSGDLRAVALREAREESGINGIVLASPAIFDVDVHRIPARAGEPEHDHYDVRFLMRVCEDAPYRVSAESHALGWFTCEEVMQMPVDASVRRLCAKWHQLCADESPAA